MASGGQMGCHLRGGQGPEGVDRWETDKTEIVRSFSESCFARAQSKNEAHTGNCFVLIG